MVRTRAASPNHHLAVSGDGIFAEQIARNFEVAHRKAGFTAHGPELSTASFRRPGGSQMDLGF